MPTGCKYPFLLSFFCICVKSQILWHQSTHKVLGYIAQINKEITWQRVTEEGRSHHRARRSSCWCKTLCSYEGKSLNKWKGSNLRCAPMRGKVETNEKGSNLPEPRLPAPVTIPPTTQRLQPFAFYINRLNEMLLTAGLSFTVWKENYFNFWKVRPFGSSFTLYEEALPNEELLSVVVALLNSETSWRRC